MLILMEARLSILPAAVRAGSLGAAIPPTFFMKDAIRLLISLVMFATAFAIYDYMSRQPTPKYVPQKAKARQMASNISSGH
jgi:hypothetical protein